MQRKRDGEKGQKLEKENGREEWGNRKTGRKIYVIGREIRGKKELKLKGEKPDWGGGGTEKGRKSKAGY